MKKSATCALAMAMVATTGFASFAYADHEGSFRGRQDDSVQLGPRPFYLVEGMDEGKLKDRLMQCKDGPFYKTDFSIGHRGAALQFPEHTKESYEAGARIGAGIVECDVTFTNDGKLVCRHSDCDLHTTTNILTSSLRNKCERPWDGGVAGGWGGPFDPNDPDAGPKCCTWNLTVDEFKTLGGKMDAGNPSATSLSGYMNATASWRTDLYTGRGTLLKLAESIALNQALGVKHTPELKGGDGAQIAEIFGGQAQYAQKFADELEDGGVKPRDVWPQSFNVEDVLYWIDNTKYGKQAVYLIDYDAATNDIVIQAPYDDMNRVEYFKLLKKRGLRVIAPPMPALLAVDANGNIVPSQLAKDLKGMGFDIITWTFERSDLRQGASKAGYYYDFDPEGKAIKKDSDMYKALDVLARQVKILGIFSDWPATVTYYANCMGLK
jgi:glycerophosphoryl diester phosphodiesterase